VVTVREAVPGDAEAVMAAHVAAIEQLGPGAYDDGQVAAWAERPDGAEPYREQARADDDEVFVVAEREAPRDSETREAPRDSETREAPRDSESRAEPDDVAGFGHLVPPGEREEGHPAGEGEVRAVYVHGDHAREGVGSALLAHLEDRARERGLAALVLWSSLNAVRFYERHGYERVRETTHETTGGVELGVVVMRKALADEDGGTVPE
jgi:putative acetyltransferase